MSQIDLHVRKIEDDATTATWDEKVIAYLVAALPRSAKVRVTLG
jgi:hypothetical protein